VDQWTNFREKVGTVEFHYEPTTFVTFNSLLLIIQTWGCRKF
jgi:hypothetical protein